MHLILKSNAHKYYKTLKYQFQDHLLVVSIELRYQLRAMKLKDGNDARAHFEKMISICEDLTSMGEPISDKDIFNVVFTSLPHSYNPILSSVSSSMKLNK
ncbi:hypothetical protein PAXINDRAFT_76263 [Paxillus involutus ATCC 200175]|nr:hypothetical protein PAXINDRAFT_76263 [Paxillus involutus ATCC 200175]